MKARDSGRLETVRMLIAELKNERIARMHDLSPDEELDAVQRQAKRRRESIEAYTKVGRDDLAAKERAELDIIEAYLPQPLTADEVTAMIREAAEELGANSRKDLGRLMGPMSARTKGRFPGRELKVLVEAVLDAREGAG